MDASRTVVRGDLLVADGRIVALGAAVPAALATLPAGRASASLDARGALVLAFRADGSMICTRQFTDNYPGKYSLSMGDYVTFRFDRPYGDTKATVHTEKITIDGEKMTMVDADGTVVKFTRAKEGDVPRP